MLNYLLTYYPATTLETQDMHLLEHIISSKLASIIDKHYKNSGLIVTSETLLDGVEITVYSSNTNHLKQFISIINNLTISKKDWDNITTESSRINKEVMVDDLSDEEEIIYSSLSFIDENIHNLYKSVEITKDIVERLQNAISNKSVLFSNKESMILIESCKYNKIQECILKSKRNQNYNVGIIQRNITSPTNIMESLFFNFIFGSIDDSLLKKIYYLQKSDYQFLSISFPYYNTDISLFMADGNNNKKDLKESINKEIINFTDYNSSFKSYSLLYDPHYLEFSKRLVRAIDFHKKVVKKNDVMEKEFKKKINLLF